jgi:hypothetical protein
VPAYNAFSSSHYIAESLAPITASSDVGVDLVLQKGKTAPQISVVALNGGATITGEIAKGDQANALGGLTLMSVDAVSAFLSLFPASRSRFSQVLPAPATLPQVLTTLAKATTDASTSGLSLYTTALNNTKALNTLANLNVTNARGLTIFAPVDSAFTGEQASTNAVAWQKVLAGHVSNLSVDGGMRTDFCCCSTPRPRHSTRPGSRPRPRSSCPLETPLPLSPTRPEHSSSRPMHQEAAPRSSVRISCCRAVACFT